MRTTLVSSGRLVYRYAYEVQLWNTTQIHRIELKYKATGLLDMPSDVSVVLGVPIGDGGSSVTANGGYSEDGKGNQSGSNGGRANENTKYDDANVGAIVNVNDSVHMADVDSGFIGVRADIEDADIDTVATGRPAIGTDRKNKLCIVFNVSLVYDGKDTLVFSSGGIETLGKARHFVLHWTSSALLEMSDIQVIINNESMQRVCKEYVESMERVLREYVESMKSICIEYVESM